MTKEMQVNPGTASTGALPEIPPQIVQSARSLAQRGMGRAVLLFLTGHAPLALLTGTLLHGVAPLFGVLFGVLGRGLAGDGVDSSRQLNAWGDFLGEPEALAALRPHLLAQAGDTQARALMAAGADLADSADGAETAASDCHATAKGPA